MGNVIGPNTEECGRRSVGGGFLLGRLGKGRAQWMARRDEKRVKLMARYQRSCAGAVIAHVDHTAEKGASDRKMCNVAGLDWYTS